MMKRLLAIALALLTASAYAALPITDYIYRPTSVCAAGETIQYLTAGARVTCWVPVVADDAITDAKLRDSGALSVIGRSANSTGSPADISASAASGAVLRESGSTLGFGTVATAGIAADAVTNAKLADMAATTIKCRKTTGTGDPEDCTISEAITGGAAPGRNGAVLKYDAAYTATSIGWEIAYEPSEEITLVEHFNGKIATSNDLTFVNGGTGTQTWGAGAAGRPGIVTQALGTGSGGTNTATMWLWANAAGSGGFFLEGRILLQGWFRVPTIADGTNDFSVILAFAETAAQNNVIRAIFDFATNSAKLRLQTRSAGGAVNTVDATLVPQAATDYSFLLDITTTEVNLYTRAYGGGDTLRATTSTSIPANTIAMAPFVAITRTSGTADRTVAWDAVRFYQRFTTRH